MKTIAVANSKGGIGKSTTVQSLAAILAEHHSVLTIDADAQHSLTDNLGVRPEGSPLSDIFNPGINRTVRDAAVQISGRWWHVSSTRTLANVAYAVNQVDALYVLRDALNGLGFDICLIDCSPGVTPITTSALVAADGLIIPMRPSVVDLQGTVQFLDEITKARKFNPGLENLGVLLTHWDTRPIHYQQIEEVLQKRNMPIIGHIPQSVALPEAAAARKSITDYQPNSKPAAAYRQMSEAIEQWLKMN